MNLTNKIQSAEQQYLEPVEQFFKSVYREDHLTSHGIDHHRRVWNHAKELLNYTKTEDYDPLLVQKIMIACYLHDIGMATDPGTRHGIQSSDLCKKFLRQNELRESDFSDVLLAIESHDNKEYTDSAEDDILLTILSVADDLDAFGKIGIERYLEIYFLRGIEPDKIGNLIIENAGKRFDHFLKIFGNYPSLIRKYRKEYEILKDFFVNYNKQ